MNSYNRHVLRVKGITVEMLINERGEIALNWYPHPPRNEKQFRRFFKAYQPWRNGIMLEWSQQHDKCVSLTDRFVDLTRVTVFDHGRIFAKNYEPCLH